VTGPSFDSGWTVADVLSHLGSGAEIFTLLLEAGLGRRAAPEFADFSAVWDSWNAKTPQAQVTDSLATNATFLSHVAALDATQRGSFSVEMFNGRQDLLGLLRLRLGEHVVHTWDVLVVADPQAQLAADATPALLVGLDELVARAGQRREESLQVAVRTSEPEAAFLLEVDAAGPRLSVRPDPTAPARLQLPAEAFIRLVYGRLDPDHTPSLTIDGTDLDALRETFPGF
jgi:uncharacterized protein (TIGR03083 family)